MNIYYNFDLEIYEKESALINDWKKYFSEGYKTFPEFRESCMWYNNGNLQTLSERRNYLNTMLNRLQKQEETEKDDFLYYEKELRRIANIEEMENAIERMMQNSILFYSMNNDKCYDLNSQLLEETEKILENLLNND